ncbi:DNA damage-inducible protein 1 [Entomophthora muscae]|uniref:DNA damage-inducible protein 1 n=1 Tax=Entomophthora muscae TaxID=34485 RepID=A0ACC2RQY8_9FUNG|nr:DNA damage-inducible protein 1 [Entomophthora muscae]
MKKLKLAPDLNYHQSYGTAGLSMTCAIGAYSALPMQFGKLLLAAPAVVLENESYNLLVGTQFLREYNGIINLKDGYLSILGYKVPLIFEEPIKVPGKRLKTCTLEGNCGKFDSLKLDSLVLDTLLSTRELSAAYAHLLVFLA